MGITIIRIITASLLPVFLAIAFYQAERGGKFASYSYRKQQIIIGVCFGIVAIMATEFSIPVNGAVLNVRDAAPLTAGLIFGWPAGILAGLIGGIHRWFSDAGDFTRVACTWGTIIAGFVGASVRRFMMENKKASWFYGLAVGITTEVLHMLMVFLSNSYDIQRAFNVVRAVAGPMIIANGVSVMLAIMAVTYMSNPKGKRRNEIHNITETFQRWLIICIVLAFFVTTLLTNAFLRQIALADTDITLKTTIDDVHNDIRDASDRQLLSLTEQIAAELPENAGKNELMYLLYAYDVTEINIVDKNGIITVSTRDEFVGYNMASGEQSAEFMPLLDSKRQVVQSYQPTSYNEDISRKYAGVALPGGGFLQVGYDAIHFQRQIDEQVVYMAGNRHIGQSGSVIICNERGVIVSDREGYAGKNISTFGEVGGITTSAGASFRATIYGQPSYCMYMETEGYYIIGALPEEEAMFTKNASVYMLFFMEMLVFALLFALIFFLIKILVVENIRKVNASLSEITSGNLNVVVDVRSNEEFASLSDDINTTVTTLKQYIEEAAARIDKELEFGRQIQHSALPSVFPPYPTRKEFSIYATMDAAKEVGGDFYDFYLLGEDKLAFLIADVSGKGIPGAMFMMTSKTLIKSNAESGLSVDEVFTRVNAELCLNNEAGMFVTAWMGVLDLQTGLVEFANAGHNPPVVKHKDGSYEYFKSRVNFVLAGMEGIRYTKQQLQLQPGDEIYLYTDGVTEAHNMEKELYGEDRLLAVLNKTAGMSVENICAAVRNDLNKFVGKADQFDDITMLSVRLNDLDNVAVIDIEPTEESVSKVAAFVEEELENLEVPMKMMSRIMIAVDEIYSNIVRYSGATTAKLRVEKDENETLTLTFRDNGKPYNPLEADDPDITASAEERGVGGLGVFMVRKMMDEVNYEYQQGMNKLTLALSLRPKDAKQS